MTEQWKRIYLASSFPILAVVLASCGGGGDGPGQCYSPGAVCSAVGVGRSFPEPLLSSGLYKGVTNNGVALAILVLDDHSFYTVYSEANNASVAGGVIQGTVRSDAGKFSVTDAVDTTLEGRGTQPLAITGTYGTKQFMDGSILFPTLMQPVLFSANYTGNFELAPDISTIAGNYSGSAAISFGPEATTFEINGNGNVSGRSISGCTFSGTIQNGGSGRPYAVTLTFGASPCRFPGATATGISYFDRTSNTLYAAGSVTGQNAGIVAIATKK